MMGSAQLDIVAQEPLNGALDPGAAVPSELKLQVAERIAAHRRRKVSGAQAQDSQPAIQNAQAQGRRANVAAAIAERYAQTPSYRAILAEQAERAVEEAAAAADVAIRSAHAVARAQQDLLAELDLWNAPQEFTAATAQAVSADSAQRASATKSAGAEPGVTAPISKDAVVSAVRESAAGGMKVRLHRDAFQSAPAALHTNVNHASAAMDVEEVLALEDEIAFRQSPVFEELNIEPPTGIAANLLEFPRQLIATRKARPRIAEGPLLAESAPRTPQLRIFEVEAEHFAAQPASAPEVPMVQSFIYLDSQPDHAALNGMAGRMEGQPMLAPVPETAAISRRLVALSVDTVLVTAAVGAFVVTAEKIAGALPTGVNAAITAALTLTVFWIMYQLLFFSLSNQTPGMRMARIGLCTLSDENPSRVAMRRRVLAQSIAVLPFGLGMLWALLDDDRLGWHDRISQMYQRAY